MSMTTATQRRVSRYIHIVVGLALGTYVYLPLYLETARDGLRWFLMVVGVPLVVASGLWMWKGATLRRRFARANDRPDAPANVGGRM